MDDNFPEGPKMLIGSPYHQNDNKEKCIFSHYESECTHCENEMCIRDE